MVVMMFSESVEREKESVVVEGEREGEGYI